MMNISKYFVKIQGNISTTFMHPNSNHLCLFLLPLQLTNESGGIKSMVRNVIGGVTETQFVPYQGATRILRDSFLTLSLPVDGVTSVGDAVYSVTTTDVQSHGCATLKFKRLPSVLLITMKIYRNLGGYVHKVCGNISVDEEIKLIQGKFCYFVLLLNDHDLCINSMLSLCTIFIIL